MSDDKKVKAGDAATRPVGQQTGGGAYRFTEKGAAAANKLPASNGNGKSGK